MRVRACAALVVAGLGGMPGCSREAAPPPEAPASAPPSMPERDPIREPTPDQPAPAVEPESKLAREPAAEEPATSPEAPLGVQHPCLDAARAHAETLARTPTSDVDLPLVEPGARFDAELLADFDGDGVCDLDLLPDSGIWNKVWPHLLYRSSDCAYVGGLIEAELAVVETTGRAGYRDLEGSSATSCAGHEFVWNRYAWDGNAFDLAEEIECCFCPADEGGCSDPNPRRCAELEDRELAEPLAIDCQSG